MAVRQRITAARVTETIDNALRYQQAVKAACAQHLVRIQIVSLATTQHIAFFRLEVEAGINVILTIWQVVLHDSTDRQK